MLLFYKRTAVRLLAVGLSTAFLLMGCKTTEAPDTRLAALSFAAAKNNCTPNFNFSNSIARSPDKKSQKRENRFRKISLEKYIGTTVSHCKELPGQASVPYASFKIPTGITGRVVNAGSILNTRSAFAGIVSTYDDLGQVVRSFNHDDYIRLGDIYGVQFSPRDNETYVVIQADPTLVGDKDVTVETRTARSPLKIGETKDRNAPYYGNNKRGIQQTYTRTYSYTGKIAVVTVFPKQKS